MIIILIKERCAKIILNLLNNKYPIKISEIAQKYKVSNRTIQYDLNLIDEFLESNGMMKIKRKPNVGIMLIVTNEEKHKLLNMVKHVNVYNCVLSHDERKNIILSKLMQQKDFITIDKLADDILVSRGTIIKDLQEVRIWLIRHNLRLDSVSKHGIRIVGDERNLRQSMAEFINETVDIYKAFDFIKSDINIPLNVSMNNELKKLFNGIDIKFIESCLKIVEEELQIIFSDYSFINLELLIAISIKRIKLDKVIQVPNEEYCSLEITKEYAVSSNLAKMFEEYFNINMSRAEIGYMTLNLLGSSITAAKINKWENWINYQVITKNVIENVSKNMGINFCNDDQLFNGFLDHLRPAVYRVINGLKVKNPLLIEIKENFKELFEVVKLSIGPIEYFTNETFDDEEIGYFTMHFGASLERMGINQRNKKNILVVCDSGIGTGKLLSAKLQSIFDVNIVDTVAYHQVNDILKSENIDLIVSTVPMKREDIISVQVQPILTNQNINVLNNYLMHIKKPKINVNTLIEIINKHCTINDINNLINDLSKIINIDQFFTAKGVVEPVLKDLFTQYTIKLNVEVKDWEDAVRKGGELLEKDGSIEHRYIDAMINSVKEIGPYIVIAPGIAMPHARPEAGSKKIGMSLITLKDPVNFGNKDNDPVSIVVCICAIDHITHIKAMAELVELLGDDKKVKKIKESEKIEDILNLLPDREN